jgi:hypothetical protein
MSLAFAFCENYSNLENGVKYVCNCLSEVGLLVTRSKESSHLILVTCSEDMLEREAGRIALRLHYSDYCLCNTERQDLLKVNKNGDLQSFQVANSKQFRNYGNKDFFLPCERNYLLLSIIEQVNPSYIYTYSCTIHILILYCIWSISVYIDIN